MKTKDSISQEGLQFMVAFDKNRENGFKLYLLNGEHNQLVNRAMRREFKKETGCHYYDTRVIPYSTFTKRNRMGVNKLDISNVVKVFNTVDYPETHSVMKEKELSEFMDKNHTKLF